MSGLRASSASMAPSEALEPCNPRHPNSPCHGLHTAPNFPASHVQGHVHERATRTLTIVCGCHLHSDIMDVMLGAQGARALRRRARRGRSSMARRRRCSMLPKRKATNNHDPKREGYAARPIQDGTLGKGLQCATWVRRRANGRRTRPHFSLVSATPQHPMMPGPKEETTHQGEAIGLSAG